MEIKLAENYENCIVDLCSDIMFEDIFCLKNLLEYLPVRTHLALNLENVDCFCREFLDFLQHSSKKNKISLFNIQSELFTLLSLTKYDQFADIYLNDKDFLNKKRKLLNRRLSLVVNNKVS